MAWTGRSMLWVLAGVALIGGLGYIALHEDPVPVDLVSAQIAPLRVSIDAEGQTRIRTIYEVSAPIAGTALRAPVTVGERVVAGESVVARVEPAQPSLLDARSRAEAQAARAEAAAALDVAQADLTRAEEEERFARQQVARTRELVERGVASITRMEDDSQRLSLAQAALSAARARSAMAESLLARAEAALMPSLPSGAGESCCLDLTAPADGVVLSVATISEHPVQSGAPLVSIGDPDDLEIVADLLSADAVRLGPGTRAIIERWGGPDPLEAVLERIEPVATTRVSALGIEEQRVDAVFRFVTPAGARLGLGHGFAVFLRIIEWESDSALQVPIGALFRRGEGWAVFVVEDGRARERPVTLGQRGHSSAEILSGITQGTQIITHPSDAVRDGVAVVDRRDL